MRNLNGPAAGAVREVTFAPAPDEASNEKYEPGIGHLQPGGLVVHGPWSAPRYGEEGHNSGVRRQHRAVDDWQSWKISSPDGYWAARFQYQRRADAEAAAVVIAAALPGGVWPVGADTAALLPLAREASSAPELLPLTHRGKPDWGSGYGSDLVEFWMPTTRAGYEALIAAHGRIPRNCQACARLVRAQKRAGLPAQTGHWPRWSAVGHRGAFVRSHCICGTCYGLDCQVGALSTTADEEGKVVPTSRSVGFYSSLPPEVGDDGGDVGERPVRWFTYFVRTRGCAVIDERDGVNLWPRGVLHDDALFSETGVTGEFGFEAGSSQR